MYSYMGTKRKEAALQWGQKVGRGLAGGVLITLLALTYTVAHAQNVSRETILVTENAGSTPKVEEPAYKVVNALVTGYNTTPEQTDASPCIAASGKNICGRKDVVACPRGIKFGTKVEIRGKEYTCEDRTNARYNGRFDVSCDKDFKCPGQVTGRTNVKIYAAD